MKCENEFCPDRNAYFNCDRDKYIDGTHYTELCGARMTYLQAPTKLTYTKQKPTEPGWYYVRQGIMVPDPKNPGKKRFSGNEEIIEVRKMYAWDLHFIFLGHVISVERCKGYEFSNRPVEACEEGE